MYDPKLDLDVNISKCIPMEPTAKHKKECTMLYSVKATFQYDKMSL